MNERIEFPVGIKDCITGQFDILFAEFKSYLDNAPLCSAAQRPFNVKIEHTKDEAEELAEFKFSKAMKLSFNNKKDLSSFWLPVQFTYFLLDKMASVMLIHCATTYL